MRRSALLIALLLVAAFSVSARADIMVTVQSETVAPPSSTSPATVTVNVYISSSVATQLNNFGYQLSVAAVNDPSHQLQFTTSANQETFGQLPSNYVLNNFSGSVYYSPTAAVATTASMGAPNNTLNGGDFYYNSSLDDYYGNVTMAPNEQYLLTQFTMTTGSGTLAPISGDQFRVSVSPGSSPGSGYDDSSPTFFASSDSQGNNTYINYQSTSGLITFNSPAITPVPPSFLMLGSGLGIFGARALRNRFRKQT